MYGLESPCSEGELTRLERLRLKDLVVAAGILRMRERGELFCIVTVTALESITAVRLDFIVIYSAKLTHILLDCEVSKSCTISIFICHHP